MKFYNAVFVVVFTIGCVEAFPGMKNNLNKRHKSIDLNMHEMYKNAHKNVYKNMHEIRRTNMRTRRPVWKPKETKYNPRQVDWAGVISGCRASCRYEKRLCNFYIRAAAHDSLSISDGYGGADGSLLLTKDEMIRPENNYDNFAHLLSKNALALAKKYDSSVADIIAVCGAVATEFLGGPTIITYDPIHPFLVGRYDRTEPNPSNALAPAKMNTTGFAMFAESKNLTIKEMTALMGSHSILDEKGCMREDNTYCNPKVSNCTDLLMYKWSNLYYKETCVSTIRVNNPPALSTLPLPTREFLFQQDMCKFTSPEFRKRQEAILAQEFAEPMFGENQNALNIDQALEFEDVTWYDDITKIAKKWFYTVHDAWMGKACQGDLPDTDYNNKIKEYMNKFKNHPEKWDKVYIRAYKKMVNTGANWSKYGSFAINGQECGSGYKSTIRNVRCYFCNIFTCDSSCKCKTAFDDNSIFYEM